ncbi:nuclear transport factor 2 family protein [Leucobacter sp. gxy201]|uniref:nuclear transport factor 2 family protein n=1 Tax=Leucobacter sp. gxy201 TaxID=2957200 RepID=UPI003DA0842F
MNGNTTPAPLQAFVDAINSADTDAFVAAFTADGFVDDWGRVLNGPDGLRSWAATDAIGAGAHMTVLGTTVDGDEIEVRFGWKSRVFNGESTAIATVAGDRLRSFKILPG